jgi:hypothetical protein
VVMRGDFDQLGDRLNGGDANNKPIYPNSHVTPSLSFQLARSYGSYT